MENTLNIQITVTDEQMTSLIKGNLENLPDDKLQEIFSNALKEFLKTENGRSPFYTKDYYNGTLKSTALLTHMIENAISKDMFTECVDEFLESIREKYPEIIKQAMIETFSRMFFSQMDKEIFQAQLTECLRRTENQ